MKINRIANFINNSKTAQAILRNVNDNPAIATAVVSAGLAGILRPTAIGCLPFKEKKDKTYSQASAVAAAGVELLGSALLFVPLNKVIQKTSDNLYKSVGTVYHKNPEVLRNYKSLSNRGIKVLSLIPLSLLRFSLVKPVVNTLFGGKHENK